MNKIRSIAFSLAVAITPSIGGSTSTPQMVDKILVSDSGECPKKTHLIFPEGDARLELFSDFLTCTSPLEISYTKNPRIVRVTSGSEITYNLGDSITYQKGQGLPFLGSTMKEAEAVLRQGKY